MASLLNHLKSIASKNKKKIAIAVLVVAYFHGFSYLTENPDHFSVGDLVRFEREMVVLSPIPESYSGLEVAKRFHSIIVSFESWQHMGTVIEAMNPEQFQQIKVKAVGKDQVFRVESFFYIYSCRVKVYV